MSLKVAQKKFETMIIELIYVVWLLFDSTKHDDAAICCLVFFSVHFGSVLVFYLLFFFSKLD